MIPINKVTSDSACRTFLSNDVNFASFINAVVFEGEQLIHPENLVYYENDTAFIINDLKRAEEILLLKVILMESTVY